MHEGSCEGRSSVVAYIDVWWSVEGCKNQLILVDN